MRKTKTINGKKYYFATNALFNSEIFLTFSRKKSEGEDVIIYDGIPPEGLYSFEANSFRRQFRSIWLPCEDS